MLFLNSCVSRSSDSIGDADGTNGGGGGGTTEEGDDGGRNGGGTSEESGCRHSSGGL